MVEDIVSETRCWNFDRKLDDEIVVDSGRARDYNGDVKKKQQEKELAKLTLGAMMGRDDSRETPILTFQVYRAERGVT